MTEASCMPFCDTDRKRCACQSSQAAGVCGAHVCSRLSVNIFIIWASLVS